MRDRVAAETAGEREARLQQMSIHQCKHHATETVEQREATLPSPTLCHIYQGISTCTHTFGDPRWDLLAMLFLTVDISTIII